jgi:V/A-type H+-transporting ATPase subunit D
MDVKPTRLELIKLRRRIKLATSGHSLLKRKRDGLIQELFRILELMKERQLTLTEKYRLASKMLYLAKAFDEEKSIQAAALGTTPLGEVNVRVRTVMGVHVPSIERASEIKKSFGERGYGTLGMSIHIDRAAEAFEDLLAEIIESAEVEIALKKLLEEIEKTKRRVNALEYLLIPRMEASAAHISMRLDEMEREDVFRLKHFKRKKKSR